MNRGRTSPYGASVIVALAIGVSVGSLAVILLCGTPFSAASRLLDVNVLLSLLLVLLGSLGLAGELLSSVMGRERRGGVDFFSPLICFPLCFALFYGLGSLEFLGTGSPTPSSQYTFYFEGLLAYLAGVGLVGFLSARRVKIRPGPFIRRWDSSRMVLVIAGFALLSTASLAFALTKTGLPVLAGAGMEDIRIRFLPSVGGYVVYFLRSIEIALALFFLYSFSRPKSLWRRPYGLVFVVYALLVLASLAARRLIFEPLLAIFIMYHYVRRRISLTNIALIGLVALAIFSAMGYLRLMGGARLEAEGVLQRLILEVQRGDSALAAMIEAFPSQEDFLGWSDLIRPFQTLLPGQQMTTGQLLKEILGRKYPGGGFVPTIVGGLYMDFGTWGVPIGMFLCGLTLTLLYLWMMKTKDEYRVMLYAYVSVFLLSALRNKLLNEIWPVYVLAVLFLADLYCRKRAAPSPERKLAGEQVSQPQ